MSPEHDFFEVLGIESYQAMELLTEIEDEFENGNGNQGTRATKRRDLS